MYTTNFETDDIPIEAREKAQHLWASIKTLVQVKPDKDEQEVVVLIASLLMMYGMLGDLAQEMRKSPSYQRILEKMKKGLERDRAEKLSANPPALPESPAMHERYRPKRVEPSYHHIHGSTSCHGPRFNAMFHACDFIAR